MRKGNEKRFWPGCLLDGEPLAEFLGENKLCFRHVALEMLIRQLGAIGRLSPGSAGWAGWSCEHGTREYNRCSGPSLGEATWE